MSRRVSQRKIDEYVMDLAQGYGNEFLKSLSPEDVHRLKDIPHPKVKDSTLTAYDYITWMCGKGYHKKAKALYEELSASY